LDEVPFRILIGQWHQFTEVRGMREMYFFNEGTKKNNFSIERPKKSNI